MSDVAKFAIQTGILTIPIIVALFLIAHALLRIAEALEAKGK